MSEQVSPNEALSSATISRVAATEEIRAGLLEQCEELVRTMQEAHPRVIASYVIQANGRPKFTVTLKPKEKVQE